MQCPDCGADQHATDAYCRECGTALGSETILTDGGTATHDQADDAGPAPAEQTVRAERQGFFDEEELSTTLKVANRGSLFVTDRELVCGFDQVYKRSMTEGVPLIGIFKAIFGGRYSGVSLEEALEHPDSIRVPLSEITDVAVEKTANMPLAARDVVVYHDGGRVAMRIGPNIQKSGKTGPAKEFADEVEAAARDAGAPL